VNTQKPKRGHARRQNVLNKNVLNKNVLRQSVQKWNVLSKSVQKRNVLKRKRITINRKPDTKNRKMIIFMATPMPLVKR
jgi:hypothetical protein